MTIEEAIHAAGIQPSSSDGPEWETASTVHRLLLALCARLRGEDGPCDFFVSESASESARGGCVYHDLWVFTNQLAIAVAWSASTEMNYRVYPKRVSALKIRMSRCNATYFPSSGFASVDVTFGTDQPETIQASGHSNCEKLMDLLGTHLAPKPTAEVGLSGVKQQPGTEPPTEPRG